MKIYQIINALKCFEDTEEEVFVRVSGARLTIDKMCIEDACIDMVCEQKEPTK